MSDEPRDLSPYGGAQPPAGPAPPGPSPDAGPPPDDEALAALERLQSMGGGSSVGTGAEPEAAPPAPRPRPSGRPPSSGRRPRPRPRAAAAGSPGRTAARIIAPVVFLVAVIVLISMVFQSGVLGGSSEDRAPVATPKATKTKKATATPEATGSPAVAKTKIYVVKSGDTLSAIALKFDTTVSELEDLNPEVSSTLTVGAKLKVPVPAP